jgi:hypothetical protein
LQWNEECRWLECEPVPGIAQCSSSEASSLRALNAYSAVAEGIVHYFMNNYTSVANEVNNLFLLFLPLCQPVRRRAPAARLRISTATTKTTC